MDYYENKCTITGKNANEAELNVHHLISANSSDSLVLNPLNGIVLTKDLHRRFHLKFRYRNNNIQQFQTFLLLLLILDGYAVENSNELNLLISSQERYIMNLSGPETKEIHNPENVMILHKSLGEIENKLKLL